MVSGTLSHWRCNTRIHLPLAIPTKVGAPPSSNCLGQPFLSQWVVLEPLARPTVLLRVFVESVSEKLSLTTCLNANRHTPDESGGCQKGES